MPRHICCIQLDWYGVGAMVARYRLAAKRTTRRPKEAARIKRKMLIRRTISTFGYVSEGARRI
jgi:hypothetical protein